MEIFMMLIWVTAMDERLNFSSQDSITFQSGELAGRVWQVSQYLTIQFSDSYDNSSTGGHHFRAWKQNGTIANSGAWFIG